MRKTRQRLWRKLKELRKWQGNSRARWPSSPARPAARAGHAIRLAQEGANIIAVDLCAQISSVSYPMATPDDLAETVKEVEALDRRIVARQADVQDEAGLRAAFEAGVAELGPVDIVLANAGIAPMALGTEPVDISNAILWLVSDDARYVTGVTLPVDAGFTNKK